ncbi:MAG TPA: mechanosensitive ion channel domain-containing protein [Reyranella sp.]|nr:mechanosensitive ion channel domain-containing protein [Reyranella sp.]
MRRIAGLAAAGTVVLPAGAAWAQAGKMGAAATGALGSFLQMLFDRLDQTWAQLPALLAYIKSLPQQFDLRTTALLIGIVVAGLAVEFVLRRLLYRRRLSIFERHADTSPLRAFLHGAWYDILALLALWLAARFVVGRVGDPASVPGKVAHQILIGLIYWRSFNFIFRTWLHPNTDEGRIAPVDSATARRLLIGLNVVILLPMLARHLVWFMTTTGAGISVLAAAVIFYAPLISAGLLCTVWYWRHDMATWLAGMVSEKDLFRPMKLAAAREWWIAGMCFYAFAGLSAIYAALTQRESAVRGLGVVESMLIFLLLLETLVHRRTRHLPQEAPTIGDVIAGCVRMAVRLFVIVVVAESVLVDALGVMSPEEWAPHDRALKLAAISAFAAYALWRILKYRMDRYIADNPLPTAGFGGNAADAADDDAPAAASRLRTIMPVLRMTAGITILVLGLLLVLSELGVNITPLIAGASVLGLAVSFGSQSLVRDIVSGVFFLAEDSFRVGEYIDGSKVKGTVEGFSIRSIRLRHQNGQLHIVPFGQLTHITNFSRDWTTVKFNLSFQLETDVELLRKTVKKIGIEMMAEPQFQKELLAPLKMQGIVDIKDASLIVRFKFTAKPNNPSLIQRTAIRRMYDALPGLGIEFAKPPYAQFGFQPLDPAARAAAQ